MLKHHPNLEFLCPMVPINMFLKEEEVVEYPYDGDKEKYFKKKSAKDIKRKKINNKEIINSIQGGITNADSINSNYWLVRSNRWYISYI